jgi:WD40 repeat protein
MCSENLRIAWLWIGSSAAGFLVGAILAITLFPAPPVDPMALEFIGNRYDLREASYALAVGIPFAVLQWVVLRYVLAIYEVPDKATSFLWVPVTGIGVAAIVFLMPSMDLSFSWSRLITLTLPAIVPLSFAQWLLLRRLIKAGIGWIFLTAAGAATGVFAATVAGLMTGLEGWALMFGACIGSFQALVLTHEFTADSKRRESPKRTQHGRGETIAGIGLALVMLAAIAPSLLQPDFRSVNSVAYSPDGKRIAADVENFVYLWDAETGNLLFAIDSGQGQRSWNPGDDLTFNANGSRIAVSSHGSGAIILNSETGERLVTIDDYWTSHGVKDIAFSPDGSEVLLTLSDGNVGLYDAIDGRFLNNFQSTIEKNINLPIVRSTAFSPDSRKVAAGGNYWPRKGPLEGFAAVWDVGSQQEHFVLTGHTTPVWHLAFSPDNTRIMTVGGESVRIWDANDGATLTTIRPDCSKIVDAVFVKDGNLIAVACDDGTVYRCETATGQCTSTFSRPSSAAATIVSIGFHPDGDQIVTATLLGSVATWNMRTGERILKLKMPDPD